MPHKPTNNFGPLPPQPGDGVVSFRHAGRPYKGVLRPSRADTWGLLVEGEWWGDLSYGLAGYRFLDFEGREQPLEVFERFTTVHIVPAPTEAMGALIQRLELCFSDDRLQYRFLVEYEALSKDWERFVLHKGGSTITLVSDRPFVRRTRGRSAVYTLRLSEGQRAAEGFLRLLFTQLRKLIQTHFET